MSTSSLFRIERGIIPALDVDDFDQARRIVAATTRIEGIAGYKLGLAGVLRLGLAGAVDSLREETDLPLLYDHQKAGPDVPDMADKFVSLVAAAGVQAVILFPLAGARAVREFVGRSLERGVVPIVGGELPFAEYRVSHGGYVIDDVLDRILEEAVPLGARHFVLPAHDPGRLAGHVASLRARISRGSLFLPGIGALGGTVADSFAQAGDWPAYGIVGRGICAAADPREAARKLAAEALATSANGRTGRAGARHAGSPARRHAPRTPKTGRRTTPGRGTPRRSGGRIS